MNDKYLSVSQINSYLKKKLESDSFLNIVYLKGEISNFKRHSRGHLYFTLKDENSRLSAVMFSYNATKLLFEPKDGMSVLVKGKISIYEASGNYQIYVEEINEDGLGDLHIKFEQLKTKLANEGLFSSLHKKKIPSLPKKIGIITAPTGAAVKDIITTINRRFPLTECILYPTLVQGEGASENIVKMINIASNDDIDVIILGRGGGSIEDLWAFNEENVAYAVYKCNIPIISAVGHEIDFTICDFVSDLRAPTPTAAAELAVPDKLEVKKSIINFSDKLNNIVNSLIDNKSEKLYRFKTNYILNNPISIFEIKEQKLDHYIDKLNNNILNILNNQKHKYININTKVQLLNPISILNKGYSITTHNNKLIKSASQLNIGDLINIKLKKGSIISKVENIKEEK